MKLFTFIHSGARSSSILIQVEALDVEQAVQFWLDKIEKQNTKTEIVIMSSSKVHRIRELSNDQSNKPILVIGLKNSWELEYNFKDEIFRVVIIQTVE
jgi:hypothetical protein